MQLQQCVSRLQFLESSTVGRSIVSKQEARVCDLENKLEFQKGQVKRFEVRSDNYSSISTYNYHIWYWTPCWGFFWMWPNFLWCAGVGAASEGQCGASWRGAGAERPGWSSGERERMLLPSAPAGDEGGDGGVEPEGAGEQPQTHGAGSLLNPLIALTKQVTDCFHTKSAQNRV